MDVPPPQTVCETLSATRQGNLSPADAASTLLPIIYEELRVLARARMAQIRPGHTLQPTALVHEAYMRLLGGTRQDWESRTLFFAAAANAMRNILVDQARRKSAQKRGGDRTREPLHDDLLPLNHSLHDAPEDLLALHEALTRLEQSDSRAAEIVKLRFFAGFTEEQIASALDISSRSVRREWSYARAWLHRELNRDDSSKTADSPNAE